MIICEMKPYTNIEQSKKLAEILPLESADAFYDMAEPEKRQVPVIGHPDEYYDMKNWAIPCWSLAALLDILHPNITLDHTKGGGWSIITNIVVEENPNPFYRVLLQRK